MPVTEIYLLYEKVQIMDFVSRQPEIQHRKAVTWHTTQLNSKVSRATFLSICVLLQKLVVEDGLQEPEKDH